MEIETTAVTATRTRRTIYNTISMTLFFLWEIYEFYCVSSNPDDQKKEKISLSPRVCVCEQRSQIIIPSDVQEAEIVNVCVEAASEKKARVPQEHGKK